VQQVEPEARCLGICHLKEAINLEGKRRYVAKALVLLFMAVFLLACGPTPPTLEMVPVATRLVETIEAEGPTGNTVILTQIAFRGIITWT
jgi:hypothetical protein